MAEPLKKTVRVRCSVEHAFDVFTSRIDDWWPPSHRRNGTATITLEAQVGGRFFALNENGEEQHLGNVVLCDPPNSISYTWYPGALQEPTLVEITFTAEGAETVVKVLHSEGESALGDQWPDRVALFDRGWDSVLAAFVTSTESAT